MINSFAGVHIQAIRMYPISLLRNTIIDSLQIDAQRQPSCSFSVDPGKPPRFPGQQLLRVGVSGLLSQMGNTSASASQMHAANIACMQAELINGCGSHYSPVTP
jgi:hypothetical protein